MFISRCVAREGTGCGCPGLEPVDGERPGVGGPLRVACGTALGREEGRTGWWRVFVTSGILLASLPLLWPWGHVPLCDWDHTAPAGGPLEVPCHPHPCPLKEVHLASPKKPPTNVFCRKPFGGCWSCTACLNSVFGRQEALEDFWPYRESLEGCWWAAKCPWFFF